MATVSRLFKKFSKLKMLHRNGLQLFLFVLLAYSFQTVYSRSAKSVSIVLDTKWKSTSLILETSEFLAEENNKLFWSYVDSISTNHKALAEKSDQEAYDSIINEMDKLISAQKVSLLKFYLSMRYYSPMVEMFQQIALDKNLPDCAAVASINGEFTCKVDEIEDLLKKNSEKKEETYVTNDHKYPFMASLADPTLILYGQLGTDTFSEMHHHIKKLLASQTFVYYVRHFIKKRENSKVRLSGYGVELAIKNTEYKAQDDTKVKSDDKREDTQEDDSVVQGFVFSTLKNKHPEMKEKLDEFKNYLMETSSELVPLKKWELQSISLQAAQKILSVPVEDALQVMADIAQNFPTKARSLVKILVDDKVKREIAKNQNSFQSQEISVGDTAMFINGIKYDVESTDIFTLAGILRSESNTLNSLHNFGLEGDVLKDLIKLNLKPKQQWAIDIRDSAIMYVNDIENDAKYKNWPTSIQYLLQMFHPGMLSNIRKNMFHMVIIADPSKKEYRFLYKMAESFYVHNAPVRIGLVFAVNQSMEIDGFNDAGVAMLNAFNFISTDKTPFDGLSFITDVYNAIEDRDIEANDVIDQFKKIYKDEDIELVFGLDSDYDTGRKLAWYFINKTGMNDLPKVILNGVPLEQKKVTESDFEETALMEVIQQQQKLARAIYEGKLSDDQVVLDWLMDQGHVLPRLNKKIITNEDATFLDFSRPPVADYTLDEFKSFTTSEMTSSLINSLSYMHSKSDELYAPNTVIVVTDLESKDGRDLLQTAVDYMRLTDSMRISVIHNPKSTSSIKISKLFHSSIQTLNHKQMKSFYKKFFNEENIGDFISDKISLDHFHGETVDAAVFKSHHDKSSNDILSHIHLCNKVFSMNPGQKALIADGKVIGPFDYGLDINSDDFNLIEKYSGQIYAKEIEKHIKKLQLSPHEQSNMAHKVASVLLSQTNVQSRKNLRYVSDDYSVIKIVPQDDKRPAIDVSVVVDPVSRGAQKVAPLVNVIKEVINANIKIFLNSQDKLSDLPLKSFYRYVLEPEPLFTPQDGSILGPGARFTHMPTSPLFTLGMVTPDNWMVEAVKTPYDLDNIHLEDVNGVVYAEFELEHILLEGHCFEQSTGSPPRGLQFVLGNRNNPAVVDTIVMANLGYFQLKASPGAWILKLRRGPSADIFEIASHENTDSAQGDKDVMVTISSFKSKVIKTRVSKKSGQENKDILEDNEEEESGIWSSITSSFKSDMNVEEDNGVINIFSLASGHLYERFIRIMMLSVLKNTKSPVKFWFLKNFLSPTIKDFLPHMAEKYGFEYELVQYKWPRWLHQQTEKQRIIWGYKILFLDVLFPLDVKKIIFVDADLVVRADLKELVDLDLEGAPYGYTPFCESRTDMDGYRFWKSGYWASHLGNRRYHISALYVVDLKKFRQIAAGDRLRGQYHGLSQDPNSLSNLDQDLPNNMIHQVKIKSLPQHWLWCETWCSDTSKTEAKTIDLCNNPKTKEPKLNSAVRIISEWEDYDKEIKNLQGSISNANGNNDKSKESISEGETKAKHTEL